MRPQSCVFLREVLREVHRYSIVCSTRCHVVWYSNNNGAGVWCQQAEELRKHGGFAHGNPWPQISKYKMTTPQQYPRPPPPPPPPSPPLPCLETPKKKLLNSPTFSSGLSPPRGVCGSVSASVSQDITLTACIVGPAPALPSPRKADHRAPSLLSLGGGGLGACTSWVPLMTGGDKIWILIRMGWISGWIG